MPAMSGSLSALVFKSIEAWQNYNSPSENLLYADETSFYRRREGDSSPANITSPSMTLVSTDKHLYYVSAGKCMLEKKKN